MSPATRSFSDLHARIKKAGLLRKRPLYYDVVIFRTIFMIAAVVASVMLLERHSGKFIFQIPLALALGFVFGQFGFLIHDTGHEQITSNVFPVKILRYFANVFTFGSFEGWRVKHNLHHSEPNDAELDPDISFRLLAFTPEQAHTKRGLARFLVKYQQLFYIPLSTLTMISVRSTTIRYLLNVHPPGTVIELVLSGTSMLVYIALWISILGIFKAIAFMVITELFFGLYMNMTIVPNHCGRPHAITTDFLIKQIGTARNISSSWKPLDTIINFFYGGLNCQIEHHLWPYMPRCNLRKARNIVHTFCAEHRIPYHSVSLVQTYKEVFSHLSHISKYARR